MLPAVRTTPASPFTSTGLDFAGPVQIRQGYTRRPVMLKAYVCIFVCISTKAVHLELCADLTTPEFMAALHHFCNRRGTPADIYSDNGTNFQVRQLMTSKSTSTAISHFTTTPSVQWHFTPPRTPHFGGLWEAGVKSMKTVL